MASKVLFYCFKVWISVLLLGPLLLGAVLWIVNGGPVDWSILSFLGYLDLFGLAFSIPSFFLFWIGSFYIDGTAWSLTKKRFVIAVMGLPLAILPFLIASEVFWMPEWSLIWTFVAAYYPLLVAAIFFYRLPQPQPVHS
jgi:hypothetical protein